MIERRELPAWATALLAVAAGLLIGAGQEPLGLWPATMIGLALLTWLVAGMRKRAAFGYGYLAGIAMNTLTISWIAVLGIPIAIGLIAYTSLWMGLTGLLISLLIQLPLWPVWVAAAWVSVEYVSGNWPFGGFAWTRLAFTLADSPLSGLLPYIGMAGVTLIMVWLSQLLLVRRWWRTAPVILLAFVVSGCLLFVPPSQPEQHVTVAVVQPNVNRHEYGGPYYARAVTNNALSSTVMAMAEARTSDANVDFVLWPESSVDIDPLRDDESRDRVDAAAKLSGAPVLVGAVTLPDEPPDSRQTSALWWGPTTGPTATYHKRNLVPFGEWIPFRDVLLPLIPMLEMTGRQSVPGTTPGVLDAPVARYPSLKVGTIVCFELAYDDTVYDTVRAGGNVIVSQSNENTYANTFQIPQQQAMNRIRAKELGREIVVDTLNSISGHVTARGAFIEPTAEFEGAERVVTVPLRYRLTSAVTVAPLLSRIALAAMVGAVAFLVVQRFRARGKLAGTTSKEVLDA